MLYSTLFSLTLSFLFSFSVGLNLKGKGLWFFTLTFKKDGTVSKQTRRFCYWSSKMFLVDPKWIELKSFLLVQVQNQNLPPLEETSHPRFHLPAAAVRGLILVAPVSIFIPFSMYCRLSSVISEFSARVWHGSLSNYLGYLTKKLLSLPGQQPACLQAL